MLIRYASEYVFDSFRLLIHSQHVPAPVQQVKRFDAGPAAEVDGHALVFPARSEAGHGLTVQLAWRSSSYGPIIVDPVRGWLCVGGHHRHSDHNSPA